MEKLTGLLNSNWGVLIAFIPLINILYLLFHFFTVRNILRNVVLVIMCAFIFPLCVVFSQLRGIVVYSYISIVALCYITNSKNMYCKEFSFPFSRENVLGVTIAVLFIATSGLWIPNMFKITAVSNNAENAIMAIACEDKDAWKKLVHPVYGEELMELQAITNKLKEKGLVVPQNFSVVKSVGHGYKNSDAIGVEIEIAVGEDREKYLVTVVYLEDENGKGFTEFEIADAFEDDTENDGVDRNYHVPSPKKEPRLPD